MIFFCAHIKLHMDSMIWRDYHNQIDPQNVILCRKSEFTPFTVVKFK